MIVAVQVLGTKYTPPYIYVHIYVFEYSSPAHMHTCIFLGARDVLWRYLSFAHSRCVSGSGAREPLAICLLTSSTTITTISQCNSLHLHNGYLKTYFLRFCASSASSFLLLCKCDICFEKGRLRSAADIECCSGSASIQTFDIKLILFSL